MKSHWTAFDTSNTSDLTNIYSLGNASSPDTDNNNSVIPCRFNVYLRDRLNQTTTLVSVNLSGTGGGNGDSFPTGLSTNGQFALFESNASDLVANDPNGVTDIFVRDVVNGTTTLVSVGTNGGVASGASRGSAMTPDGGFVAFTAMMLLAAEDGCRRRFIGFMARPR